MFLKEELREDFENFLLKNVVFFYPKNSCNRGLYIDKNFKYLQTLYMTEYDIANVTEDLNQNKIIDLYKQFLLEIRDKK